MDATRGLRPSFETRARRAPQDEGQAGRNQARVVYAALTTAVRSAVQRERHVDNPAAKPTATPIRQAIV